MFSIFSSLVEMVNHLKSKQKYKQILSEEYYGNFSIVKKPSVETNVQILWQILTLSQNLLHYNPYARNNLEKSDNYVRLKQMM